MKYIVILGDGMADYPVKELDDKTPLEKAYKPNIDLLCKKGVIGLVSNVPENLSPGSDVANLSAMGYDPQKYYSGRSPLEAVSIGIDLKDTDVVFRCNVVTLTEEEENYEDKKVIDHSADEITTEEATLLIKSVQEAFGNEFLTFYPGISYRHALVWDKGSLNVKLTPPHDILERVIGEYMPKGDGSEILFSMMKKSYEILKDHPVNVKRKERGLNPANSIWIWGEGKKPLLDSFEEKYGKQGAVISAVDLIKGIAICASMESIDVEGATGNIHSNFKGKADAALKVLRNGKDFVYIHMEAPDECGHRHEIDNKVKSIEIIDKEVVGYMVDELKKDGEEFKIIVLPDHPTPLELRTHTREPVPFIIYDSTDEKDNVYNSYTEENAKKSGVYVEEGYTLLEKFFN